MHISGKNILIQLWDGRLNDSEWENKLQMKFHGRRGERSRIIRDE
jgi:hypothetical protein